MAQIKKDTSLRKSILQAAITGQLISDIGGESDVLFSNEKKSKTKLDSEADLPLASRVSKRNSVVSDSERTTPSPRGYAPKTPNEFANFENQNSVSERSERPTLPETGKQLLDRIIEERNNKLLADWKEKQTDLFASNDAHSKNAKTVRSEQIRLSKKIKKPEPIVASEIDEDEIPFEIPENWCWCRLGDLAFIARGGSPRPINEYLTNDPDGYNWIKISDTDKGGKYINSTKQKIKKEGLYKTRLIHKGDFLLTNSMSFGRPYISNIEGCIHDGWLVFSFPNKCISPDFIYHLLSSSFIYNQFADSAAGAVVQNLNTDKVIETLIPLPPLSVQNAIVAKLEQVLPLVDAYENALLQKEELKSTLGDKVKKAILQEAITGKLTESWRKSATIKESGKQLLDRIIEERNAKALAEWEESLKKNVGGKATLPSFASKTRAKKPVPVVASEIEEEEIPFEVPENWCWCHLGEICNEIKRGKSPKYVDRSDYLAFAQKCNVKTGGIDLSLALYLDEKSIDRYSEEDNLIKGDVVINSTGGGTMGRVGYYETKVPEGIKGVYPDSHVTVIRSVGNINQRYLYYILKHNQPVLEDCGTGSTNQTELKPAVLANFVIPLPPLEEQEEIVKKVEELLLLCK